MKLFYTPKSHFSRKVRILLAALKLEAKLVDVGNVANSSVDIFGPNPLMKVPTLIDDEQMILDSDYIAQYLVKKYDPKDQFRVLTSDVNELNLRAVMNGVMSAEVELILAKRTGIEVESLQRFNKIKETISRGLEWLELRVNLFPSKLTYSSIHLCCMWEHLDLYKVVSLDYPALAELVKELGQIKYIADTRPTT